MNDAEDNGVQAKEVQEALDSFMVALNQLQKERREAVEEIYQHIDKERIDTILHDIQSMP